MSAPQTSQLLAGHTVNLLEQQGDWWRLSGADAYEGWMHRGYLEFTSGDEQAWRVSLGARVQHSNLALQTLPLHARVPATAAVVAGEAISANEVAARFPLNGAAVVQSALTYFAGASYQWGGVTPWGCDCSGLVQTVFALHGHQLPRDAWQQAETGRAVPISSLHDANALNVLEAGDLLFFSDRDDRHVTHVGVVAAGHQFVHSALGRGGVHVETLTSDNEYVRRLRGNFVLARRLV